MEKDCAALKGCAALKDWAAAGVLSSSDKNVASAVH
jgi:hypothetical protein